MDLIFGNTQVLGDNLDDVFTMFDWIFENGISLKKGISK